MKKIMFVMIMILLLNLSLAGAVTQQELNEAKSLIDSKTDCKSLSDSQLEIIGEYYMEQMHPGEAHELMHKMMGLKEGSEDEKQFHINMAKIMYCEDENIGIDDYQKAIREAYRVTKPDGKLLVMMLNPESEYFHEHMQREDSYFKRIRHTNLREIKDYISRFYEITKEEYFLGIRDQQIVNTAKKRVASLYVIVGKKKIKGK